MGECDITEPAKRAATFKIILRAIAIDLMHNEPGAHYGHVD